MQTLDAFFGKLKKNKEELCQHNSVTEVVPHRTEGGIKLVPVGSQKKQRKERSKKSRREAAEADGLEEAKKTISFGTNDGNSKAAAPSKPALRRGNKEKIRTFKHELVVEVRIRVSYTKGENEVRKQVYSGLGGTLDFIRETLLEGESDVVFLGKEEWKSKATPIRTTADFPSTACALTKKYAVLPNESAFRDGRQTTKAVDLFMIIGMDVEIEPKLGDWRTDLEERGVTIRKKPGQIIHTYDGFMLLGTPTPLSPTVVKRERAYDNIRGGRRQSEEGQAWAI